MRYDVGETDELNKLREALALSRRLVSKSRMLVAEWKRAKESSSKAIDQSYEILNKATGTGYPHES